MQRQPFEACCKTGVFRNFTKFTGKHRRQGPFFNKKTSKAPACNVIKKETLSQAFSCEFCKISKNNFFTEHFRPTASGDEQLPNDLVYIYIKKMILFQNITSVLPTSISGCKS